jgi:stage II sporulation protein D
MQYEGTVSISTEGGVLKTDSETRQITASQVFSVDRSSLFLDDERYSLPVTIESSKPVTIEGNRYYGHVLIRDGYIVNVVPIELYTLGVLNGEIPASWPLEVVKAQAVVSRTYAYSRIMQSRDALFHAGSTEMYQKYEYDSAGAGGVFEEAVRGTKDQILLYRDAPIEVFFHACSGGRTENSRDVYQKDLPYLKSIPDPYCGRDERFAWTFRIDALQFAQTLNELGLIEGRDAAVRDVRIYRKTGSGRAGEFQVLLDDGETIVVQGNRLRLALDPKTFKSLLITRIGREKTTDGTVFVFQGRGYGHGVGMSQWGAKVMADQGFSYRHILTHYYRGTRIGTVWDIR